MALSHFFIYFYYHDSTKRSYYRQEVFMKNYANFKSFPLIPRLVVTNRPFRAPLSGMTPLQ